MWAISSESSRRTFLKQSGLGIATAAATRLAGAFELPQSESGAGNIQVWITDQERRCAAAPSIPWRKASSTLNGPTIMLDPDKKFQSILGFGGAFTDAACYMFNQLEPTAREKLFHEMFSPSELGLNVCRTCIGASDYSTEAYTYDEGDADPELKRFSIERDRKYILPILRQARAVNPDLFLFSSPWTPPGWMKSGGSMLGGSMRRRYLGVYAEYFVRFLQAYTADGVPVQAVTPQNEVDTDQDGKMPACIWPQEYEIEFVRKLGPLLKQNGLQTKIWILDHNYNLWGRAIGELEDRELRQHCNAVAWHGYVGQPAMMTRVHDEYPDVSMYWTEGGPDYTSPDYLSDWTKWVSNFNSILRNWCQSITAWNLALDEVGKPNIGPFPCGGVVAIHSKTKEITRSGQFWALAHFSRFIRQGALRFDSQGTIAGLDHVAFQNPDGKRSLVVSNSAGDQSVLVQHGGMQAELSLKKDSVATLVWS
ncbi:MAG TPA: glycoside hydrolase family 30 beta sandwich domain-containing protein [Terriglobales bacterium]